MYDENVPTIELRRDQVKVGDVIRSSHGYRLLITHATDDAHNRTDDRHVWLGGMLHASLDTEYRSERYPAGSMVTVERPARTWRVIVVTPRIPRFQFNRAVGATCRAEAMAVVAVRALSTYGIDGWVVKGVEEVA